MRVFIDTNVMMDYLTKREPFWENASIVIDLCVRHEVIGIISALTVVNIAYLVRKIYSRDIVHERNLWMMNHFDISGIDCHIIKSVLASPYHDFEDMVQYHSALNAKADVIVTRNVKDFQNVMIDVCTPTEFVERCKQ